VPRILIRAGKLPYEPMDPFTSLRTVVTGTNVGNMLFSQSVFKALSLPQNDLRANGFGLRPGDAPRINDSCDMLVLPLANQFRLEFGDRLDAMATTIRKLKVPVVVVGVGCQTDLLYNFDNLRPIDASVKRFVGAVLDKSATIGVRGHCTGDYLTSLGFNAVDVIGCPSMFMDGPTLASPRPISSFDRSTKLAMNVTSPSHQSKFAARLDVMGQVIGHAVAKYDDIGYISQEDRSLHDLLFGTPRDHGEHAAIPAEAFAKIYDAGGVKAVVDPRAWMDYLRDRQFVFGTRLHGGIAGLLAGTAARLVATDSRTLEIAEYFDIPHFKVTDVVPDCDPRFAYESADYSRMVSGHRQRFETFATFLSKNGLGNVYSDGDGGRAFDAKLAAADLSPIISPLPRSQEVALRMSWTRTALEQQAVVAADLVEAGSAKGILRRLRTRATRSVRALRLHRRRLQGASHKGAR